MHKVTAFQHSLQNSTNFIISVQIFLRDLKPSKDNTDAIKELATNLETMGQYEYAVKFYLMIGDVANHNAVSFFFPSPQYEVKITLIIIILKT